MLKIVEHSAARWQTQQNEFDKFFVKFLRKEGTDSNGNYRVREYALRRPLCMVQ